MDKKKALKKVKENGWYLEELPANLKKDRDIVIEALKGQPGVLEVVDKSLQDDKEIVNMCIINSNNGMLMKHAGKKLKKNKEFIMDLLKKTKNNYVFEYADKSLENDPDLNEQAQKNLKG